MPPFVFYDARKDSTSYTTRTIFAETTKKRSSKDIATK